MNHPTSRARRPSPRRQPAQRRRAAHQAGQDGPPGPGAARTFSAAIEALSLATDSLPALVRDWLVRGIQAVAQAVALAMKQQWALLTAPPLRQLPPPTSPDAADGQVPDIAKDTSRRWR